MPFVFGVLAWTLFEYITHCLLHYYPKQHAIHHAHPSDYTVGLSWLQTLGMFMAPLGLVAVFNAWMFYGGFVLAFGFYSLVHYACHHNSRYGKYIKWLRRLHAIHHYSGDRNYGVSSPLWDIVFRTYTPVRITR